MSSEVTVSVQGVSKCYQIYKRPTDRLKQFFMPYARGRLGLESRDYYRSFWALDGVSLEVAKGETVGIVGRNGSGKSTLLQIICGTLMPTSGSVETAGRIAALLELGSGFNPEFTGRENVYMNAAVLGLTQAEVSRRFDSIVDFADIGDFLDQPVKTYSSGMMVRLAFAVQAQVEPDILIIDEALAVGDARFQAKCFERLRQLKESGTSILLVTHSVDQIVTHTSRALLLDAGKMVEIGQPRQVVNRYLDMLFGVGREEKEPGSAQASPDAEAEAVAGSARQLNRQQDVFSTRQAYNPYEFRWGDGAARILDFSLEADGRADSSIFQVGQQIRLGYTVKFEALVAQPIYGVTIKTKEGLRVCALNSEMLPQGGLTGAGQVGMISTVYSTFVCRLAPGDYFLSVGVASRMDNTVVPHDRRFDSIHFTVSPTRKFMGLVDLDLRLEVTGEGQTSAFSGVDSGC